MENTPGQRIKQWRELKGLTLSQVSKDTGIKVSTLSTSEQPGSSNPSFDTLNKLLGAYPDLNPDWLLTGTGPMLRGGGRALSPAPTPPPTPQMRISARPVLSDEQASELLIENARLQAELNAANGIIELKDSIIGDLRSDKSYYQDELRKKPEAPADAAAPLVRHPRASSMVPSACREQHSQAEPEALMLAHVNEQVFALGGGYEWRATGAPESTLRAA